MDTVGSSNTNSIVVIDDIVADFPLYSITPIQNRFNCGVPKKCLSVVTDEIGGH